MTTYRVCFCFKRRFTASNETPEVIKEVFRQYSENGVMGPEELMKFMVEVQGDKEVTREEAQAIIDAHHEHNKHVGALHHHHHHHLLHHHRKGLTLEGFFHYVFSEVNNPPVSSSLGVHQDMKAPLSHYFIYTGHNSYLTGNQISSVCSDVPIVKALKKGVRVIELDMWPNSTKDDIDILHGGTLTTPVELIKCLRSIKEHAFTTSPYPVILTLEDHLTPDLQAKAAKMISETFGESLFVTKSDYLEEFPSPEELKMKIIISTKPPKEYLESKSFKDKEQESSKVTEDEAWGAEVEDLKLENELQIENEEQEDELHGDTDLKSQPSLAPEYKHLIAIKAIKRMSSLKDSLMVDPNKVTRLSLGEQKFAKAVASHPDEVVRFAQRNLLRIYPKATRVTSSNYNPLLGWTHGAQMVALNMQGYGRSLWLMQGMFRANGECGYVKKPDILIKDIFNPKAVLPVKKTLKVTVYMGDGWRYDFGKTHFDTYSPPDFYTRVGIAGVQCDAVMKRTKAIEDNWSPVWNEEFVFPLCVPELALLIIEVHEYDMSEKDDFGGQICLPVWELRPGIRTVRLCDRKGDQMNSVKLLMRFEFI
ncbi:LOW QUALITY PROTEIN: phosphoinositide phospholipase C 2-like [Dioscorea cayenensis subsp. rotundata]|uniref:Phosphoinositide phospholipase C n=1 Tax=Dioscorea cayennensis subsp. rotundata TaxID=55577 RepID=A0AB40C935_DIOCR|nr:LOW QUALITY PROTEIN: phosphoinositide phospholipase C 2-like [Dioscorea cayenensis subsp. rotundata]